MDKVKEILKQKASISEALQKVYFEEIKKHQAVKITFYETLGSGVKIPSREFFVEIVGDKVVIKVDGLDLITPKQRTFKLKDLNKLTGLFAGDFNIKYF